MSHHTVGHDYRAWDGKVYECVSYSDARGYRMRALDGSRVTDVSPRAIGATFHKVLPHHEQFRGRT